VKPRPVTVAIIAVLLFALGWLGVGFARGGGEEGKRPPDAPASSAASSSPTAPSEEPQVIRRPEISPAPGPPQPGEPIESPVPKGPEPETILLVSGHSFRWITPCGCEGVRAGGVARRSGYGQLLRKTYPGVSVHYLDLGGVLSLDTEAQRITTDALIDAMEQMKYEAMNVAVRDLGKSLADSEYVRTHLTIPRISANIVYHDTGKLAFPPYRVLQIPRPGQPQADPIRIGLLGLVDDRTSLFAFGDDGRSLVVRPIVKAIRRYLPSSRAERPRHHHG
jgi:hypothetical protein